MARGGGEIRDMAVTGGEERKGEAVLVPVPLPVPVVTGASGFSGSWTINLPLIKDNPGMASLVARGGGDEQKVEAVPVPVVAGASNFSGSWTINPPQIKDNPGLASLVARRGGDEQKAQSVPVPVVTGASNFSVSWTINPPLTKDNPGMASLVARGGGEIMGELEMVPVTGANGIVRSAKETARSAAWFALVHAAVALVVFLVLKEQDPGHLDQCLEACKVLTILEFYTTLFPHFVHVTMTVCSVVQMLGAALALVSTGRIRWSASFLALCLAVATGTQWIRLVYTALFGSHCCYSGGFVQVTSAVAIVLGQGAIPLWGGFVAYELVHAPLP